MYSAEYGSTRRREFIDTGERERRHPSGERLPTLEKRLDRFFDTNIEAIIEEWGMVTARDLAVVEKRLDEVSREIQGLESEKSRLKERALAVEAAMKEMERP